MIDSPKKLIILPTSRSIREAKITFGFNTFLPTFMRLDEFESRAILINDVTLIDALTRVMLLKEVAQFEAMKKFNINFNLVRFFTKSDAIFRFFEELAFEKVDFEELKNADVYSEFAEHISILEELQVRYQDALEKKRYIDRAFLPSKFSLNDDFLKEFDVIELYLEGHLSRFEFDILDAASKKTNIKIIFHTSRFTRKMHERFAEYDILLPEEDSKVCIDFSSKTITYLLPESFEMKTEVVSVNERIKQIPVAMMSVQKMIDRGVEPANIAIILPDESYKEMFHLFDRETNLNFAMGFDYKQTQEFKIINALMRYFKKRNKKDIDGFEIDNEALMAINYSKKISVEQFFEYILTLTSIDYDAIKEESKYQDVYRHYVEFLTIFSENKYTIKDWIFLWLKSIEEITLDDSRGGKITVIGALETRGVKFEGVVVVDFNEGIIPALPAKDQFLNSTVRSFASLPTKKDREALQKQLYKRVLEQAKYSYVVYSTDNHKSPSRFIYELSLGHAIQNKDIDTDFYYKETNFLSQRDAVVAFDATSKVWSPSMLETFLTCKRKYYFKYIKNIKSALKEELIDGVVLHDLLLKIFAQNDTFQNKEALIEKIKNVLDELDLNSVLGEYKKLSWMKRLEHFADSQIAHFHTGWRVDHKELAITGEIEGLRFQGRVDRIDVRDNEALILDYKSGNTTHINKSERALESNFHYQMNIYMYLLKGKYKKIDAAFVKIFDVQQFETLKASNEKNLLLLEHIRELKDTKEIIASRCEDNTLCKYCDYSLACQRGEYI
jgi:RecB family exonuclease